MVSVNHTSLSAGSYSASITVSSANADNSPQSLSVSLSVAASTPPLSASVLASPTSGPVPLTVNFTGSASGGTAPYTYSWAFGDGGSSTSQSPSHTYSTAGSFTAVLTINDSQNATDTETVTITVSSTSSSLTATASGSPTSGQAPLAVNFTGKASGGISPYSYRWEFGDGAYTNTQNPTHTYTSSGTFTATLTITDNQSSTAKAAVAISVGSANSYSLSLSAQTGSPAPGQGGTTNPAPGNYNYPLGSSISLKSLPNTDYRFSRWSGDIQETSIFGLETTVSIDQNKSISSTFCTKCGDVNGNLQITPADAQAAFDIFLGKIGNPTWCQKENADVNSSGTKLDPKVTPADAQMIFNKFLKKGESGDCSGSARSTSLALENLGTAPVRLTINGVTAGRGEDIYIPILIDSNIEISAFGLDLAFSSRALTFLGVERTEFTEGYQDVAANVILPSMDSNITPDQISEDAIVRVGGYRTESGQGPTSGVLVVLVFRVKGDLEPSSLISIIATYDDLQNALLGSSMIRSEIRGKYEREIRDFSNKSQEKRSNF